MNHFASSRIAWKFLRAVLLTNVQRDVALRRGWLVRFVEKETQKRGDVGDRRRTRGNTRRIRFFLDSVSFLHTTKQTSSVPIRFDPSLQVFSGPVSVSNACFFNADESRTEAWPTGNFRIATIRGERAFSRGNLCYIIIDAISLRLTPLVVDPIPR